jgi:hypothetical protein
MTFGISTAYSTNIQTGTYENVLYDVKSEDITNEEEVFGAGDGLLAAIVENNDPDVLSDGVEQDWDLNILNFGQDMADPQAFLLLSNWLSVRYALDYDCNVFDKNGVCVALNGQYSNYSGTYDDSEWSGVLKAAKQLGEKVRIGGYIDIHSGPDDIENINDVSMLPTFGLFLGYSEAQDGTGLQGRVSAAYQFGTAEFTHSNILGSSAQASGDANLQTFGAAAELGWGYAIGSGHVVTPFAGLTYAKSTRGSYDDGGDGGSVEDPFSYEDYSVTAATGYFGLKMEGPLAEKVLYRAGVGLEGFLEYDLDSFEISGEFGSASYDSDVKPSDWAVSGAVGLSYLLETNKMLTLDGYIRQVESGEAPYYAISAGFKMGF